MKLSIPVKETIEKREVSERSKSVFVACRQRETFRIYEYTFKSLWSNSEFPIAEKGLSGKEKIRNLWCHQRCEYIFGSVNPERRIWIVSSRV